jgi:tagatose 1,6-diphosphate aldolase
VGRVNVRERHTPFLTQYGGLLGYSVEPAFRGRRLAGRAVALLLPFIRGLGNAEAWITCNPDNIASRRTLERLGAEFIEIVTLPPGNAMYDAGDREKCRYRLVL